jgi:hypothetical protein
MSRGSFKSFAYIIDPIDNNNNINNSDASNNTATTDTKSKHLMSLDRDQWLVDETSIRLLDVAHPNAPSHSHLTFRFDQVFNGNSEFASSYFTVIAPLVRLVSYILYSMHYSCVLLDILVMWVTLAGAGRPGRHVSVLRPRSPRLLLVPVDPPRRPGQRRPVARPHHSGRLPDAASFK